ncbi:MAG: IS110 family transposase [Phaeovulum sp.]|uniref:IS110 family transposase n=1 Tax=Phaeovulum sp. TaxID=2934796 RepID=UPI0027317362|nr:IS110 family transposase [Phaeovulum sp.]MDP2063704.1 IS110 family transposase [Phaeovulum sp.]
MDVFIGIDVAMEVRRACAMYRNARVLCSHAVDNDPAALGALIGEIEGLEARCTRTAVDMLGGAASLLCAMLAEAGLPVVHTPGRAVNRARQGIRGGERKSDPKGAAVIAEPARTRADLRAADPPEPLDAEIRLLVSRRRELVTEQTRRAGRLRDLLCGLFPALERRIDPTTRTGLVFLSHYGAPEDIRAAGVKRIVRKLARAATGLRGLEALAARDRLKATDQAIRERLAAHPDAALILSMPGMGATLTAVLIALVGRIDRFDGADALAAAAGLAPVLRQSGKTRFLRRAAGRDKALKRVFYQAAFTHLGSPDSRAFNDRKRAEGKRHHQAIIALARRRVNMLWAILQNREPFRENVKLAA